MKCSRRIRPIVSTTSIPHRPLHAKAGSRTNRKFGGQSWTPIPRLMGSFFHAGSHEKTKIVYCKDQSRRDNHSNFRFDFLGYMFRPRMVSKRYGGMGVSFSPAASPTALKAIRRTVRGWALHRRSHKALEDLARMFNSHIRGWINYYGRFCPSALYPTL